MAKPRIFLGSSGKQKKLLQALTRGLEETADVEPWTAVFNPGTTTLGRLLELTREVDFAAFVFAQDDWTSASQPESSATIPAQASPRDNVVFEAGLFGGVLGMRRTFILHANGAKLLKLSTIGIMQYIAPTMIFLIAVFGFGEELDTARMIAFPLIWAGLFFYSWSMLRTTRGR